MGRFGAANTSTRDKCHSSNQTTKRSYDEEPDSCVTPYFSRAFFPVPLMAVYGLNAKRAGCRSLAAVAAWWQESHT
eukprot:12913525-Prorocentrum_lima.AAC.1